jgi:hypothetical protein
LQVDSEFLSYIIHSKEFFMQAIKPMESRSKEYAQESAKTDGMSKGPALQGAGGKDGDIINMGKRGGAEYTAEVAKTDGMCK